jgi:hypothetical protein
MQYKTIVLELLQEHQGLYETLRQSRTLLPTLEVYARDLKTSHQAWKERLLRVRPDSNERQIESEALEIGLKELEEYLFSKAHPEGSEEE